jgi:cytochrome c
MSALPRSAAVAVFAVLLSARLGPADPIGLGHAPTQGEVAALDISIGPDGKELPPGQGDTRQGNRIYHEKCQACHGATGTEGPNDVLVGGRGSLATGKPLKTIGSYWPYATTIYDYISRAMPFNAPGSLTPNEVYAVTAFLLYRNGIIDESRVIDAQTLPSIVMPNRQGFRPDPRPDVPPARHRHTE